MGVLKWPICVIGGRDGEIWGNRHVCVCVSVCQCLIPWLGACLYDSLFPTREDDISVYVELCQVE